MDNDGLRKSIVASVERIYNVHDFSSLELKAEVGFPSVDLVYVTFTFSSPPQPQGWFQLKLPERFSGEGNSSFAYFRPHPWQYRGGNWIKNF